VLQPVTADDDYSFYAGLSGQGVSPEAEVPDSILPLLDFVSIHTYPLTNQGAWAHGANLASALALMTGAVGSSTAGQAQYTYTQVRNYIYAHGAPAGLPITVGETGWKWRPTNPLLASSSGSGCGPSGSGNPLEGTGATCSSGVISGVTPVAATPANAKWYYDEMNSWQAAGRLAPANGPLAVFYFEATDEVWKGLDDGWGLWTSAAPGATRACGSTRTSKAAVTASSCPCRPTATTGTTSSRATRRPGSRPSSASPRRSASWRPRRRRACALRPGRCALSNRRRYRRDSGRPARWRPRQRRTGRSSASG